MTNYTPIAVAKALLISGVLASSTNAFVPSSFGQRTTLVAQLSETATDTIEFAKVDERTSKPTGTSFLPYEIVELAAKGNPIEKAKLAKDGTSAFVDVYEYAAKIRAGELTWEELEAVDLNVSIEFFDFDQIMKCRVCIVFGFHIAHIFH